MMPGGVRSKTELGVGKQRGFLMATKRAQRLDDFLSNELGWETKSLSWSCVTQTCGFRVFSPQLFCSNCGKKMPNNTDKSEVCNDLERAISYALGEDA